MKRVYWGYVLFLATFVLSFLLGAYADSADARKHGLPVPQLWQKYRNFKCVETTNE